MTLLWIGDALLIVVVLPIVIYLLNATLKAAQSIVPSVRSIAASACSSYGRARSSSPIRMYTSPRL